MQTFNVMVNGRQCKTHMGTLIVDFNKAFDAAGKTGAGAPTFEHFEVFMKIFEKSASLIAPVVASVGLGLKYSVQGVQEADSTRVSRTRTKATSSTTTASRSSKHNTGSRPIYKSWNQQVQERQLELKEQQNEEFRLMREGFDKKSEERHEMIKQLVQLAAMQMAMAKKKGKKVKKVKK